MGCQITQHTDHTDNNISTIQHRIFDKQNVIGQLLIPENVVIETLH